MTTPFRISEAVFIESAYISGEAKMSISTAALNARALGPQNVQAIVGLPGGMFVKHKGAWNFCPWANVKSARLIDVPAEIEATAEGDIPTRAAPTAADIQTAVATVKAAVAPEKYEGRRGPGRPRKGTVPVDVQVVAAAEPPATVTLEPVATVPARDAGGVLISLQPTSGPTVECAACGSKFIQGANHVCTRPVDDLV